MDIRHWAALDKKKFEALLVTTIPTIPSACVFRVKSFFLVAFIYLRADFDNCCTEKRMRGHCWSMLGYD